VILFLSSVGTAYAQNAPPSRTLRLVGEARPHAHHERAGLRERVLGREVSVASGRRVAEAADRCAGLGADTLRWSNAVISGDAAMVR